MVPKAEASFTERILKAFRKINSEITVDSLEHDFSPRLVEHFVKEVLGYQGNEYIFERGRTDITLLDESKRRVVVMETKRPKESLDAEKWRMQAGKYADSSTLFVGLTNGYRFLLWQVKKGGERELKADIDFKGLIASKRASEDKLTTKETEQLLFLNNLTKEQVWSVDKYSKFDEYYATIDVSDEGGFSKLIEQLNYISNDLLRQYTYSAFDEYYAGYAQYKQTKGELDEIKKANGNNKKHAADIARFELKTEGKYQKYASFWGYYYWKAVSNRPDDKEEENKRVFCQESIYLLLNRLLFIRICEDRGLVSKKISNGGAERLREQLMEPVLGDTGVFKQIVQFSYGGAKNIYHHFYEKNNPLDWYESGDGELSSVLNKVLWILNQFNFAGVDRDILGKLYEKFLPKDERKKLGEFYTPDEVIDYILDAVEYVPSKAIEGKDLIDPACGSGGFLVRAARRLIARQAVKFGKATPKEALDNKRWSEVYSRLTPKECEEIVNSVAMHIHGFDINPFAVGISEMNLLFQIIDLYSKAAKANNSFKVPRFKVYETDSLEMPTTQSNLTHFYGATGKSLAKDKDASDELKRKKYDFVVGNPPYVRTHEQELTKNRILTDYSDVAEGQFDLFIPFVKFGWELLKPEGKESYIISNKLLSNDYAKKLRKFLLEKTTIEQIIDSSEVLWFEASVYPIIFVVRKAEKNGNIVPLGHITSEAELICDKIHLIELPVGRISALYNSIIPSVQSKKEFDLLVRLSGFEKHFKVFRPKPTSVSMIGESELAGKPEFAQEQHVQVVSNEDVRSFHITPQNWYIDKKLKDTPETPHVLMKKLCKDLTASPNPEKFAAVNTTYVVQSDNNLPAELISAMINSKVLNFYAKRLFFSTHMRGGYIELRTKQIENLPVTLSKTIAQKEISKKITDKVKEILKLKKKDKTADITKLEIEIDDLVFELYGITPEERKIIEKAVEG
jgi:type I restriction-modification system DNA methylase subunit